MSKRVFIGVGHGGMDPGAVGYVKEADANLVIALELKKQLEAAGVSVGISRVRDENDDINEEIREANAFKPDLAFEVHNNAGGGDGFEVYIGSNQYTAQSRACAEAVEAEVKAVGQKSRGVKTGTYGWVRLINAPAILTEGFFVDNRADAADFDTVAEQQALGRAYARGALKYLGMALPAADPRKETVVKKFGLSANTVDYLAGYNGGSILRKLTSEPRSETPRLTAQNMYNLSDAEMKHMDGWPWAEDLYKKITGGK